MLATGEAAESGVASFNNRLQVSARDLAPALVASLKSSFGDQVEIQGDAVVWKGE